MMQDTPTRPHAKSGATYADIEALPPHMVGEILFNVLHASPRPAPRHGEAAFELAVTIGAPFGRGRPGGWRFQPEPELHLGPHVVVPDIAGWRLERLPRLPASAYFETSPDWIAEILSPSTQRIDRTDKLAIYAEYEVAHAWYVDPIAKTLEVMTLLDGKWQITATFKSGDMITAPPFEAHTFPLDVLWPDGTSSEPQS